MKIQILFSFLAFFFVNANISPALAKESNLEVLKQVWTLGSQKSCTKEMQGAFNQLNFDDIVQRLNSSDDRTELARVLNPFLFSLGWSHTEFFPDSSESYYFFKGHEEMLNPKSSRAPRIINPGIQIGKDAKGFFIREVLDGFPAHLDGIQKLDRVISLDGATFMGNWGTHPRVIEVGIERYGQTKIIKTRALALNWSQALQDATQKSIKFLSIRGSKNIGYVHLWNGVHLKSAELLKSAVDKFRKANVAGVILDLRGGYGGAWWDHLDPFFPDTSNYMVMTAQAAVGAPQVLKSPFKKNKNSFEGPMVVLINEGVRSGKEALAYQFKKTERARIIGEKTAGYFSAGQYFFANKPKDCVFYLCVFQAKLDGVKIEGVGISPDDVVPFENSGEFGDSQLNRAIDYFTK